MKYYVCQFEGPVLMFFGSERRPRKYRGDNFIFDKIVPISLIEKPDDDGLYDYVQINDNGTWNFSGGVETDSLITNERHFEEIEGDRSSAELYFTLMYTSGRLLTK